MFRNMTFDTWYQCHSLKRALHPQKGYIKRALQICQRAVYIRKKRFTSAKEPYISLISCVEWCCVSIMRLFCGYTWLFCGYTGLFCGDIGLFCFHMSDVYIDTLLRIYHASNVYIVSHVSFMCRMSILTYCCVSIMCLVSILCLCVSCVSCVMCVIDSAECLYWYIAASLSCVECLYSDTI